MRENCQRNVHFCSWNLYNINPIFSSSSFHCVYVQVSIDSHKSGKCTNYVERNMACFNFK
jgi:hypothetical protein